jgi:hypothetical protein
MWQGKPYIHGSKRWYVQTKGWREGKEERRQQKEKNGKLITAFHSCISLLCVEKCNHLHHESNPNSGTWVEENAPKRATGVVSWKPETGPSNGQIKCARYLALFRYVQLADSSGGIVHYVNYQLASR